LNCHITASSDSSAFWKRLKTITPDGSWQHEWIVLHPDSQQPGYEPIIINWDTADDEFAIMAELLIVLEDNS
uniref:hypothetical protein n=1 Tax=Castellaniella defragrans TaxID=75697 RepID=UPI0033421513